MDDDFSVGKEGGTMDARLNLERKFSSGIVQN